jgi:hypothetical protein
MGRVRSLHMSPADDSFISSGDDATVRLWDLRTPVCRVGPNFSEKLIGLMNRVYSVKWEDHLWWHSIIPELSSLLLVPKLKPLRCTLMLPWIMYVTLSHCPERILTKGTIRSRSISRSRPSRYLRSTSNTHFYLNIILKRRELYPSWNIL